MLGLTLNNSLRYIDCFHRISTTTNTSVRPVSAVQIINSRSAALLLPCYLVVAGNGLHNEAVYAALV